MNILRVVNTISLLHFGWIMYAVTSFCEGFFVSFVKRNISHNYALHFISKWKCRGNELLPCYGGVGWKNYFYLWNRNTYNSNIDHNQWSSKLRYIAKYCVISNLYCDTRYQPSHRPKRTMIWCNVPSCSPNAVRTTSESVSDQSSNTVTYKTLHAKLLNY